MAPRSTPRVLPLLTESWHFLWKQPVLGTVMLWFFIVPYTLIDVLGRISDPKDPLTNPPIQSYLQSADPQGILIAIAGFLLSLLSIWGTACILLVGRRLIQNRAGRSRTSFASVRKESMSLLLPLVLTALLRTCIAIEWAFLFLLGLLFLFLGTPCKDTLPAYFSANPEAISKAMQLCPWPVVLLPLLIPAALYLIRTSFFSVVIATEDLRYREALRRSKELVRGRLLPVVWFVMKLTFVVMVPASLIGDIAKAVVEQIDLRLLLTSDLIGNAASALAGALITLTTVGYFGALRKHPSVHLR